MGCLRTYTLRAPRLALLWLRSAACFVLSAVFVCLGVLEVLGVGERAFDRVVGVEFEIVCSGALSSAHRAALARGARTRRSVDCHCDLSFAFSRRRRQRYFIHSISLSDDLTVPSNPAHFVAPE